MDKPTPLDGLLAALQAERRRIVERMAVIGDDGRHDLSLIHSLAAIQSGNLAVRAVMAEHAEPETTGKNRNHERTIE